MLLMISVSSNCGSLGLLLFVQLNRRKEQMKKALDQQKRELAEKRRQFEEDKKSFDEEHQKYLEQLELSMRSSTTGTK